MQPVARARVVRTFRDRVLLAAASLLLGLVPARAVIFYSTGDPDYNSSAPAGALANSGWQYEGLWGSFLGTAIGPNYFITASHVGGAIGDPFLLGGTPYPVTAVFDDPASDLRIWRVCGTFPAYAPLYTNTNEVNKSLVVIGRGTQRADLVTTTNFLGNIRTNGWIWGLQDGRIRWGENVVAAVVNGDGLFGGGLGDLLQATFDAGGVANECHLSNGDSGGAVFIQDGSVWKLAGINYAVDGPYNTSATGPGFSAAIFDARGLYTQDAATGVWQPESTVGPPVPGSFYASRISSHVAWIDSVLASSPHGGTFPTLQSAAAAAGPYADETNAIVDESTRTITVALPAGSRFYRLRACSALTVASIKVQDGSLVLTYQ